MEIVTQWIQPIAVILIFGFTVYQTIVLRTQVTKQKDIIAGMQAYQNIIKLDQVEKYVQMREQTFLDQVTIEKNEFVQSFKKSFEESETEHKRIIDKTTEEVQRKEVDLRSVEQRLTETENALESARQDLSTQEAEIKFYLNTNSELLNLAIKLTATYISQDHWNLFADQHTKEVNSLFKETLNVKGIEVLKERDERRKQIESALIGNSGLTGKLFKGKATFNALSELRKYQNIGKYYPTENEPPK